jgi:hypothetical protein
MSQTTDRARVTPLLIALVFALSACDAVAPDKTPSPAPAAATSSVTTGPRAQPTPDQTPMPLFGDPVAIGADARAGVISGGVLAGWIYDGRTGTLLKDGRLPPASVSPRGRWSLDSRNVMSGSIIERTDLWLIDNTTGTERLLYSPPELPPQYPGKGVQPNPNIPAYVFQRTEYALAWSPDEKYLTMAQVQIVSGSADADGRPLVVIEVATGKITELGYALYGYAGIWRAPHVLAYVEGAGRETWRGKALTVWTPENGKRALTDPLEVGLAPTWGPDGQLWFAEGPAGPYDVPTFFSGRGIGDRSVYALDIATGQRTKLPRVAGYADEGARVSDDGRHVLINRRRLDPAPGGGTKNSWLELWIANVDGSDAKALVKMSAVGGFGYYGGYGSLAKLEWVR